MTEYGRIGRVPNKNSGTGSDFCVMMLGVRSAEFPVPTSVEDAIIIEGRCLFQGRWMTVGDIGPVDTLRAEIEWLDDE